MRLTLIGLAIAWTCVSACRAQSPAEKPAEPAALTLERVQTVWKGDSRLSNKPVRVQAPAFKLDATAPQLILHELVIQHDPKWDVRWVTARSNAGSVGLVPDGRADGGQDQQKGLRSIWFSPETIETPYVNATGSPPFKAQFAILEDLRHGYASDLAIYDEAAGLTVEDFKAGKAANPADVQRKLLRMVYLKVQDRRVGDYRIEGRRVTAHLRMDWASNLERQGWRAMGILFDAAGHYRGSIIISDSRLGEGDRDAFVSACADLLSRMHFEDPN